MKREWQKIKFNVCLFQEKHLLLKNKSLALKFEIKNCYVTYILPGVSIFPIFFSMSLKNCGKNIDPTSLIETFKSLLEIIASSDCRHGLEFFFNLENNFLFYSTFNNAIDVITA